MDRSKRGAFARGESRIAPALERIRALERHWFSETELVRWCGRAYLHKRFRVPLLESVVPALPRALARREIAMGRAAAGIPGIAAQAVAWGDRALLREWVEGRTLRELARAGRRPPDAFFDELEAALRALHARGVAYNDLERKDNVLVDPDGHAVLIDLQLAARGYRGRSRALAALSRWWIRELQRQDLRYLFKRKRKLRPDLCTPEQLRLSRERSPLARAYHPLWRVLHGAKRRVWPKGGARASRRA
jgi:serine/threonine protein kinase